MTYAEQWTLSRALGRKPETGGINVATPSEGVNDITVPGLGTLKLPSQQGEMIFYGVWIGGGLLVLAGAVYLVWRAVK